MLDPCLRIPSALLSRPLTDASGGTARPNLRLETREGILDAEVWIVPHANAALRGDEAPAGSSGDNKPVARIELSSQKGSISLRLVRTSPL